MSPSEAAGGFRLDRPGVCHSLQSLVSRPVPQTLGESNLVAESSVIGSFRVVSRAEWCRALVVVVVVAVVVVATSPLHEGDGDRGRALEGAGYRVCASPSSASQTLTVLNLRPPEPPNTSRLSRSDVRVLILSVSSLSRPRPSTVDGVCHGWRTGCASSRRTSPERSTPPRHIPRAYRRPLAR